MKNWSCQQLQHPAISGVAVVFCGKAQVGYQWIDCDCGDPSTTTSRRAAYSCCCCLTKETWLEQKSWSNRDLRFRMNLSKQFFALPAFAVPLNSSSFFDVQWRLRSRRRTFLHHRYLVSVTMCTTVPKFRCNGWPFAHKIWQILSPVDFP